jgi:hypothetical protein
MLKERDRQHLLPVFFCGSFSQGEIFGWDGFPQERPTEGDSP